MTDTEKTETKRDRVRRLVINPLQDAGMRFPHRMPEQDRKVVLDRLCDELAYASDHTLAAVAAWARSHGDGSDRSFFPPVVSFLATVEAYEPRALEEVPVIASWFKSRAGAEARDAGRLVAEFLFIEKKKRPPLRGDDRAAVSERKSITDRAAEWGRRLELVRDRRERGGAVNADDLAFLHWFERIERTALALVEVGEKARKAQGAVA